MVNLHMKKNCHEQVLRDIKYTVQYGLHYYVIHLHGKDHIIEDEEMMSEETGDEDIDANIDINDPNTLALLDQSDDVEQMDDTVVETGQPTHQPNSATQKTILEVLTTKTPMQPTPKQIEELNDWNLENCTDEDERELKRKTAAAEAKMAELSTREQYSDYPPLPPAQFPFTDENMPSENEMPSDSQ